MPEAPVEIRRRVETFARGIEQDQRPEYKESELRVEFIHPFWTALGWDVENKAGYAAQSRDGVEEEAIREGAPDYSFRIGGIRKFFLTKRPGVNIGVSTPSLCGEGRDPLS